MLDWISVADIQITENNTSQFDKITISKAELVT